MHFRTSTQLFALAVITLAGACQLEKAGTSESDTELGSESGSSGSDGSGSSTDATVTTGEPLECTPGETMDGGCGNICECTDDGTWSCTDKGCASLEEGFAETLTSQGGCSDVFIYAQNPGATISVELRAMDLVAAAKESGMVTKSDFTLPSDAVELTARTGQSLHEDICTDFLEIEPIVDLTYLPTAGTVTITVTPGAGDEASTATAELKNVVWALGPDPMIPTVSMPSLVIKDVSVGWFPG